VPAVDAGEKRMWFLDRLAPHRAIGTPVQLHHGFNHFIRPVHWLILPFSSCASTIMTMIFLN
jgi:hypothetical protein